jgi:putative glutamine amidotransferase
MDASRATPLPLIGISTSELRTPAQVHPSAEADPPRRELALALTYPRAVERSGGIPLVVPPGLAYVEELVTRLDGLLLSGGPDLHPAIYGEQPDPALGPTEPDLDDFELELARQADALGVPILALCRGAQLINVARGGTLIQDLPSTGSVRHRQTEAGEVTTHTVRVPEGSRLAGIMGAGEHSVNSFHHQAIRELGAGLQIVAWASDELPEAIEATDREFEIGVQWHAESLTALPDQSRLFAAFIKASARRAQERDRRHGSSHAGRGETLDGSDRVPKHSLGSSPVVDT